MVRKLLEVQDTSRKNGCLKIILQKSKVRDWMEIMDMLQLENKNCLKKTSAQNPSHNFEKSLFLTANWA